MVGCGHDLTRSSYAQIKNGSVTGRDIKDKSLTAKDLAASARRAGPRGPAGSAVAYGTVGATGILDETMSKNVVSAVRSVTFPSTYCITLDPKVWKLGQSEPVFGVDRAHSDDGATTEVIIRFQSVRASDCTGDSAFTVKTFDFETDFDGNQSNGYQPAIVPNDEPFSFVMP